VAGALDQMIADHVGAVVRLHGFVKHRALIGAPVLLPPGACRCRSWVNSAIWHVGQSLPVYPDKRTILEPARTSHLGQQRT
jgi:hypothetical protein